MPTGQNRIEWDVKNWKLYLVKSTSRSLPARSEACQKWMQVKTQMDCVRSTTSFRTSNTWSSPSSVSTSKSSQFKNCAEGKLLKHLFVLFVHLILEVTNKASLS